jgi:serpin B
MTYAGARGNTAKQMEEALHFTLSQARLHNAFNALDLELAKRPDAVEKDGFKLHICNAAWGQKGYSFLESYLDVLALNYGSGFNLLDFIANPANCRLTINDWVSLQTEDRIKDLLPDGSLTIDTRLVLTNAIYFKAGWLHLFDETKTAYGPFFLLDGTEISAQVMKRSESFNYTEVQDYYQAIELQYKGEEVSMVILLPASGRFKEFEASLNADSLNRIIDNLTLRSVSVQMPKFSFEWKGSLSGILKGMGMSDAFDLDADFSGIDGANNLFISEVYHQSFVAVDEAGTEAAAATAVVIDFKAVPDLNVTVNRPFVFLIRDRVTGAVLFLGRVLDPGE